MILFLLPVRKFNRGTQNRLLFVIHSIELCEYITKVEVQLSIPFCVHNIPRDFVEICLYVLTPYIAPYGLKILKIVSDENLGIKNKYLIKIWGPVCDAQDQN